MKLPAFLSRLLPGSAPQVDTSSSHSVEAATQFPSPPPPKVKPGGAVLPSFNTTRKPSAKSAINRTDRGLANLDLTTYRVGSDSRKVIKDFARASPELSAAVTAYVRTGITKGYTCIAYNLDGTVNPEATGAAQQMVARMDVLNDYTLGFDDSFTLRGASEVFARELATLGAACGELVLDKTRLPLKIQPVSSAQIRMFPTTDGKKRIPKQFVGGDYIDLDQPTFFMVMLDEDLDQAYPVSPIESAIQAVIFSADFMNDIRRVVKKAIHPRVTAVINEEKFLKSLPPEARLDQAVLNSHIENIISSLEDRINSMEPDEALVFFDSIGVEVIDHGNTNLANEYTALEGMANAKVAAGTKALPVTLGQSGGSSNTASTEAVLFVKYVEGTVWAKLNEIFSKIFTLGVRILGHDVYVKFTYNAISLKPDEEMEAFKAMKQSRILELLSLGMMADEQACIELTGQLPPAGMKPLSGTGFMQPQKADPAGGGYNGASNSGSTLNQKTAPDTPTGVKSKNQGKTAEIIPLAQ